jgi:MFS family permease
MDASPRTSSSSGFFLMAIAFLGIFVYGMLTALPGAVLPELEQNKFLANDAVVGTFLFINAIGAVLAYLVSGPITDRLGKKFTRSVKRLKRLEYRLRAVRQSLSLISERQN